MDFDLKRISALAKLIVADCDAEAIEQDMAQIIEFVSQLPEAVHEDVTEDIQKYCTLRDDSFSGSQEPIDISEISEYTKDGYFTVPKTV